MSALALTLTPMYAVPLAVLYLFLTFTVISGRRRLSIGLGDGGNKSFRRRIRAHGNFSEYVPMALLLMAFAELGGAAPLVLHSTRLVLLAGRLLHAYALAMTDYNHKARVAGMILTITSLVVGIGACLNVAVFA